MKHLSLISLLLLSIYGTLSAQQGEPFYRDVLILENGTILRGTITLERNEDGDIEFMPIGKDYNIQVSPQKVDKRYRETIYVEEIPVDKTKYEMPKAPAKPSPAKIIPVDSVAAARRRHYVGVSLTALLPTAGFGSSNYGQQFEYGNLEGNSVQFANNGYGIGLDATLMFTPKSEFGVAASLQSNFNSIKSEMSSSLANRYGQGSYISAIGYRNTVLVGGLTLSTPLNSRMKSFFDVRIMFGGGVLDVAEGITANFPNGRKSQIFYDAKLGGAFVLDLGFHFNITNEVGLALRAGYTRTDYWNVNVRNYQGYGLSNFNNSQPKSLTVRMEQLTAGIGVIYTYKLKKK